MEICNPNVQSGQLQRVINDLINREKKTPAKPSRRKKTKPAPVIDLTSSSDSKGDSHTKSIFEEAKEKLNWGAQK